MRKMDDPMWIRGQEDDPMSSDPLVSAYGDLVSDDTWSGSVPLVGRWCR
jgi:hypothetical protein